jgi:hypothetical protein
MATLDIAKGLLYRLPSGLCTSCTTMGSSFSFTLLLFMVGQCIKVTLFNPHSPGLYPNEAETFHTRIPLPVLRHVSKYS